MYLEFLYIPLDYISILNNKERFFEYGIPLALGIGSSICEFASAGIQLSYIGLFIPFAEILLGFMLTALALIVSSEKFKSLASKHPSSKTIRNVSISLYRVLVVEFSYIILVSAFLIACYFIAQAIPIGLPLTFATVINSAFVILSISLLFSTIRAIANLYFTQSKV